MKKCLILSSGPPPTPEHKKVEGGGLRCWGLAKGLKANDSSLEITLAYHEIYKEAKFTSEYEGISLTTWRIGDLDELLSGFDSIIVSYCMGDLSVEVAKAVRPDQQLVLDCYVPIYVEVSARQTNDLEGEYSAFYADVERWAQVLKRGDLFLCASQAQKRFYQGVLSGLGRVNPATYEEDMILIVPYGIYREAPKAKSQPITKLLKNKKSKKILWFGGIYPWFDLRGLVDAILILNKISPTELIIVGARNPFNDHPDFVRKYDELVDYIEQSKAGDLVIMQDWVKFDDRADWYLDSDIVVVINKFGDENELAWRTRLVDFVWADLPVITNAKDPLGEDLIHAGAALRFSGLSAEAMAKDLEHALASEKVLSNLKKQIQVLKPKYYWDTVTQKLSDAINLHFQPADRLKFGDYTSLRSDSSSGSLLSKTYSRAKMLPAYTRKHGLANTYFAVRAVASKQINKNRQGAGPKVIFVSHQLDISGAPFVLMEAVKEFRQKYPKLPVDFYTFNPAKSENLTKLNKIGIKPKVLISRDLALEFTKGDVVVLNTVAYTQIFKSSVYNALEAGKINQLIWYVHEDEPELIFDGSETKRIKRLLAGKKLTFFVAAEKIHDNYVSHFANPDQIRMQPYRVTAAQKHQHIRPANDFNDLRFILPGTAGDGRKGHLPILYAFIEFKERYYDKHPTSYRDFKLDYVGLGDDFISRQITNHAPKGLADHFTAHRTISHDSYLSVVDKSNITICYSIREALPLFVFEGMYSGHPVLRNDSSGQAEQLVEGKNGFYLDSKDFGQVVSVLETALNKQKTSNEKLAMMSKQSHDMAVKLAENTYSKFCQEIKSSFNSVESG